MLVNHADGGKRVRVTQRVLLETVVCLCGVAQGVHARHGRDEGRHGHCHAGVENRNIRKQEIAQKGHLQMFFVIFDYGYLRHF